MGFWDEYKDLGGGGWVSVEEKDVLMENGIPLTITGVVDDPAGKYGARFVVQALIPDPETGEDEERKIGFPKDTVESRDRMLTQLQQYLDGGGDEPVVVKLEKVGRSIILRKADA